MFSEILAEIILEKLQAHLQAGHRLEKLADELCVRPAVLRRLIAKGENATCSWSDAYLILRYFMPDQVIPIFTQHAPEYLEELLRMEEISHSSIRANDLIKAKYASNPADVIFKSENHYRVYAAVLTELKIEDIASRFGEPGLSILNEFLAAGIVIIESDGKLAPSNVHTFLPSTKDLIRQAELNLKLVATDPYGKTWTRLATLTDEAINQIDKVMADSRRSIWDIITAHGDRGKKTVHITMAIGRDIDAKFSVGFEDRVNSYKKAYDLDESTASKVAMIAHDMRGPLGYLAQYMEKLEAKHHLDADYLLAKSAMNRVNSMVQCFKDLKASSIVVRQKDIMYLDECRSLAESYALQTSKRLEYIGSSQVEGEVDSEKLDRALQNLIVNAFDAALTAVRIEIVRRDSGLIFRVSDDGPGVSEENIPKLFRQGFTAGKLHGTGLGLAFVKHVVDGHGGDVVYQRSREGWTSFTMTIPHVFFDGLLDDVAGASDKGSNSLVEVPKQFRQKPGFNQKPLLLVLIDFPYMTPEKFQTLRDALPEYEVSSSYDDIPYAWFICFDAEDSMREFILDCKINAVWMPEEASLRSSRFVETLQGMALYEFKKYERVRRQLSLHHAL